MPAGVLVSFLGITWKAKDRLPSRKKFFDFAEETTTKNHGADEARRMLRWFK